MTYSKTVRCDSGEKARYQSLAADRLDFLFTTRVLPCPYLPGNLERKIVADLSEDRAEVEYERMIRAGYRRSGSVAYRHACPNCCACIPVRLPIATFNPGKSLRRVARVNLDLIVNILPSRALDEHYDLFRRYQIERHSGGEMANMSYAEYRDLIEESSISTCLAEFRLPGGELAAVCLYDELTHALSAIYTFFDPTLAKRSLGSYMIIWLAKTCCMEAKDYLYLGYWISNCAKMSYKARFRPLEKLDRGVWSPMG